MGFLLILNARVCLKNIFSHRPSTPLFHVQNNLRSPFEHGKIPNSRCLCFKGVNKHTHVNSKDKERGFSIKQRPSFPKSVFAAGTAKRIAELSKKNMEGVQQEDPRNDRRSHRMAKIELPDHPLTATEWKHLKEQVDKPKLFEVQVMKGMFSGSGDIDVAKSLLTFVALETGTLPYDLLLSYLNLCVSKGHYSEMFDVYDIMKSCFPTLETGAYSLFIKGFSQTDRWQESLVLLERLNRVITPSARNYSDTIAGAVLHKDNTTAWALYNELIEKGVTVNQETWQALFQSGLHHHGNDGKLLSILHHMRENQIFPEEHLAAAIKAWFESFPDQKWSGHWSYPDERGVCQSCGTKLESIHLNEEEYCQLKERIIRDVIQGKDVFKKSTPEELMNFKNFVTWKPVFDVVMDGLNVAHFTRNNLSETLLTVVSELKQQGKSILVLGRKHMLQHSSHWNRHHMKQIQQMAHCFFTDNISEDDPFLLYATLNSGNHCVFLSKDLMRDHKACLPDSVTRRLFFKWQRGHQLVLSKYTPGRRVQFQKIMSYDTIVQTNGNSWHIPYDEKALDRYSYEVPQKWLCLTKVD